MILSFSKLAMKYNVQQIHVLMELPCSLYKPNITDSARPRNKPSLVFILANSKMKSLVRRNNVSGAHSYRRYSIRNSRS